LGPGGGGEVGGNADQGKRGTEGLGRIAQKKGIKSGIRSAEESGDKKTGVIKKRAGIGEAAKERKARGKKLKDN